MKAICITFILLFLCTFVIADTLVSQGFEASSQDTWNYTANPEGMSRLVWWGRSDQSMGGTNAQAGSYYWASWDLDNQEHTLTFDNVALPTGYLHTLSFYYYTNGLTPSTDYSKYCIEYDNGTQWTNWVMLNNDTEGWILITISIPAYVRTVRLKLSASYDGFGKYAHWDNVAISNTPAPYKSSPIVYNTTVAQRTDGSKLVDIYYSLFDSDNDPCTVSLLLSTNGGDNFAELPSQSNQDGDIGTNITNGTGKHIVWNAGAEGINYDSNQCVIRIVADDNTIPNNFVYVEGGTFNNGTANVTVSSFYLDKFELTQAEYQAVMGTNPSFFVGHPSRPVEQITWFNAIEFCNKRSINDGLTPCYSYLTYGTNTADWPVGWNTIDTNHSNVSCSWSADGYRLPTEMEWFFAAVGGNQTRNYSYFGSNQINDVVWYTGNSDNTTHPVGQLSANELGFFDMGGNVMELVWDIAGPLPTEAEQNPIGVVSGINRIHRNGSWNLFDYYCNSSINGRSVGSPTYNGNYIGFRVCRPIPWVAMPNISPSGGYYNSPQTITITCATDSAQIFYTTDGSEPTQSSTLFIGSFTLSSDCTLKAKAFKTSVGPSATIEQTYRFTGFVFVEGGTFNNGTSNITLSSFYIDKFELTQAGYQEVMGINPSYSPGNPNKPVEQVSWYKAIEYCNKRSMNEGMTPCYSYSTFGTNPTNWPAGWSTSDANHTNISCNWTANGYRLPTEMEWMFAAKGGIQTHGYSYSGSNNIDSVAWYYANSSGITHQVGNKTINELGLYDMSGNVWEWLWDIYNSSYPAGPQYNPYGVSSGPYRGLRGGCWYSYEVSCTVDNRDKFQPTFTSSYYGFRICRSENNFVLVSGGTFNNGTSNVTVSSFYLDKYELTQAGYQAVMGTNPSYFTGDSNKPVEYVSWFNSIEYCNRRSIQEGLSPCYSYSTYGSNPINWPTGWNTDFANHTNFFCNFTANGYRLPTEMEWEYAAIGGNQSHNYTYSGSNDINAVAWYSSNSGNTTHQVGTKTANELGLCDMSGNVWEWCWDIFGPYSLGPQTNPVGAVSGSQRTFRSGAWHSSSEYCGVRYRASGQAIPSSNSDGFRVCKSAQ